MNSPEHRLTVVKPMMVALCGGLGGSILSMLLFDAHTLKVGLFRELPESSGWFKFQHLEYNAYLAWRPFLFSRELLTEEALGLQFGLLFLLSSGAALLALVAGARKVPAIGAAIFAAICFPACFGHDAIVLGALAWTGFCVASLLAAERLPRMIRYLLLAVMGLVLGHFSNQMAPSVSLLVLLLGYWGRTTNEQKGPRGELLLFTATAWSAVALCPVAPLPDFPGLAHVVPDDGLPGHVSPLLFDGYPLPVIDWLSLRPSYLFANALLFAVALTACVLHRPIFRRGVEAFVLCALGLSLLGILDALPFEELRQVMPLATISRVLPGGTFFPLAPITLGFSLISLIVYFSLAHSGRIISAMLAILLLWVFGAGVSRPIFSSTTSARMTLLQELPGLSDTEIDLVVSPSNYLIRQRGVNTIKHPQKLSRVKFVSVRPFLLKLEASGGLETLGRAIDHHARTRWSPHDHPMHGGEWIKIVLKKPLRLEGVQLDPGKFTADFPAGLRLSFHPDCISGESIEPNREFLPLANRTPWLGRTEYTPRGFPYFGSQSDVSIFFAEPVRARCLLIEQTGERPFNWSIAHIRLAGEFTAPVRKSKDEHGTIKTDR